MLVGQHALAFISRTYRRSRRSHQATNWRSTAGRLAVDLGQGQRALKRPIQVSNHCARNMTPTQSATAEVMVSLAATTRPFGWLVDNCSRWPARARELSLIWQRRQDRHPLKLQRINALNPGRSTADFDKLSPRPLAASGLAIHPAHPIKKRPFQTATKAMCFVQTNVQVQPHLCHAPRSKMPAPAGGSPPSPED